MESSYSVEQTRRAQALTVFGRRCLANERVDLAISYFEQALAISPQVKQANIDLARLLYKTGQWERALKWCEHGISTDDSGGEYHKWRIAILSQQSSIEATFVNYQLNRCDPCTIDIDTNEILCCTVVRNSFERIPFFLEYYRGLGVNRFFFVDNDSTDETVAYLLQQPDVHVWCSPLSFKAATFGSAWFELIMQRYGQDHWWVMADIDELLVYANSEQRSLRDFCQQLEANHKLAASGLFLDMYSNRPIQNTAYTVGSNLLDSCPFFDKTPYHARGKLQGRNGNQDSLSGGVRQRVFPQKHSYLLTKTPLIYYQAETILYSGQHFAYASSDQIAHEICVVLHFKFIDSFVQYSHQEVERNEHAGNASHYRAYTKILSRNPQVTLFDPALSVRYENTRQLRALNILQAEPGHYEDIRDLSGSVK